MKVLSPRLAITACIAASAPFPCAARAETLAEAVAYAYDTNPGLQAQRAAQKALDETYTQARSGYDFSLSASLGETSYEQRQSQVNSYANTASQTLSLNQPLYTGGRVRSRVSEAEAQILAGRETLRQATLDLVQRVVTAYSDVLRDQQLLQINKDTVSVLEKEAADTTARFGAHDVTETDVAQSKARLAQAQAQLAAAEASLDVSRAEFASMVGRTPLNLAELPAFDAVPKNIDEAFAASEEHNPTLLGANYTEQSSRAKVAEAKAGVLPTVSAQLSWQHTPFVPYLRNPYDYATSGGVVVSVPIFAGGQIASTIRQARDENDRDRLSIDDTRRQVIQNVSALWAQLVSDRNTISTLEQVVKADEFAFYGVRQERKFALRETIEVLNAELELTNAQQELVRARAAEYVGRVQLVAFIGTLTAKQLAPNLTDYDPEKNFNRVKNIGATPLDIPVRVLDAAISPPVGPAKGASVPDIHPGGAALPPAPTLDAPIKSILSTLEQPPPKP